MERNVGGILAGKIVKVLVANAGSSSRRYALFHRDTAIASGHLERKGAGYQASMGNPLPGAPLSITEREFMRGPEYFRESLLREGTPWEPSEIGMVALRVVAPGSYFQRHARMDEPYLKELEGAADLAPLHAGPILREAKALRKMFPSAPLWGISDSAFHATLPPVAREYALPMEDASRWDIHRFGYHGISAQSVLGKLKRRGPLPGRIILCHLGSGASVMAIRDGKSLDVSMGFSPLEGLLMGTRIGDFDPAAVLHLGRKAGMDARQVEDYLNTRCGLLGLSGTSADMRTLLESEAGGDAGAASAIEAFVYRIRKYIGAFAAALGGIDRLVFTAAIGERSPAIRARICLGLEWMGIRLDPARNAESMGREADLQSAHSSAGISVVMSDEAAEIFESARHAAKIRDWPKPGPSREGPGSF